MTTLRDMSIKNAYHQLLRHISSQVRCNLTPYVLYSEVVQYLNQADIPRYIFRFIAELNCI